MSDRKIQIWFRPDQAECAISALAYISARFDGHADVNSQPAVVLACNLAKERAIDVCRLIERAVTAHHERAAKAEGRAS